MSELINVPGLERAALNMHRIAAWGRPGVYGMARLLPEPIDDDSDGEMSRPFLEGQPCAYNKPMRFNDQTVVLNAGCFSKFLASGKDVPLCIDHDATAVFADKSTGLRLFEDDTGLLFEQDLARCKNPQAAAGIVSSKNRRCLSVSFNIIESEMHDCGGTPVRFVTEAALNEFSLVKLGKNTQAFAFITDRARYAAPTATTRSDDFKRHQTAYLAERAAIDTGATPALLARIEALETRMGILTPDDAYADHKARIASILRGEHDPLYHSLAVFRR